MTVAEENSIVEPGVLRKKKKEIGPFDVISENSSPKGFFWPNKKKSVISLLSADSRYFRTYARLSHDVVTLRDELLVSLRPVYTGASFRTNSMQ